ncbi:hypothetical protein ACFFGH_17850 [Lysobacter korlensis]|uniref:Uncharacterized protein n=1 Tax=Lysobacter korlensis TaxID=553636 RepID=A0ABV6RRW2_9GAMM
MPDPTMPSKSTPHADPLPPEMQDGHSPREYGHSSEDRNTRKRETDWPSFHGGTQTNMTPGAPGELSHKED